MSIQNNNLEKLSKIQEYRSNINEFIEFCNSNDVYLFDADNPHTSIDSDDMIFKMFNIDKIELEKERQELLNVKKE